MKKYADLLKKISQIFGYERGAIFGWDILMGLEVNNAEKRYEAWLRYIKECESGESHTDEQRDGAWVPAISL